MGHHSPVRLSLVRAAILAGCGMLAAAMAEAQSFDPVPLDGMVPQLSSTLLASWLQQNARILVFDVREREEFAVSRLPGAMHVSPSTAPEIGRASCRERV